MPIPTRFMVGLWRRLYVRIWLAVVLAVVVLTLVFGWLLRLNTEHLPAREVLIRDDTGAIVGQTLARPGRVPGQGVEFQVNMKDGRVLYVQLPPRMHRPGAPPPPRPWINGPMAMFWMLGLVAVAVALGVYPMARRLTQRLEQLQKGVEQWGHGDLSARITVQGRDEVADLAEHFNQAAARIEELVQSHEALLTSNRSLLANASHELRSPLARIRMSLELMGSDMDAPAAKEITRSIGELNQLIDEILLASRLDAHEADMGTVESLDLTGLVAEECARGAASLECTAGSPTIVVHGIAKLLRRAVRNLLENAGRHGRGQVQVHLLQSPPWVIIRVCDRGPGVPENLRERIFEPFFRLPGASETDGGVGLGLALVRSIAQRHHGHVHCEAQPGGGACFVLKLPLQSAPK